MRTFLLFTVTTHTTHSLPAAEMYTRPMPQQQTTLSTERIEKNGFGGGGGVNFLFFCNASQPFFLDL